MRRGLMRMISKMMAEGFTTWNRVAKLQMHYRVRMTGALQHMLLRDLSMAWVKWRTEAESMFIQRMAIKRAVQSLVQTNLATGFRAWRCTTQEMLMEQEAMEVVAEHWASKRIAQLSAAWSAFTEWYVWETMLEMRAKQAYLELEHYRLEMAMSTWIIVHHMMLTGLSVIDKWQDYQGLTPRQRLVQGKRNIRLKAALSHRTTERTSASYMYDNPIVPPFRQVPPFQNPSPRSPSQRSTVVLSHRYGVNNTPLDVKFDEVLRRASASWHIDR